MSGEFGFGIWDRSAGDRIIRLNDSVAVAGPNRVKVEPIFTSSMGATPVVPAPGANIYFGRMTAVLAGNQLQAAAVTDTVFSRITLSTGSVPSLIPGATSENALANLRRFVSPNDLFILRTDGTRAVWYARTNSPTLIAAMRAAAIRAGHSVMTGAEVIAYAESALPPIRLVPFGLTPNMVTLAPASGAAVARFAPSLTSRIVGGAFLGANVLSAGLVAIQYVASEPNNITYRQGRLQLTNIVTSNDEDRLGMSSTIYFTPLNVDPVCAAQVTLGDRNAGVRELLPYRIVSLDGSIPSVDVTQPSRIPFTYDPAKLAGQGTFTIGRPLDIFMCSPRVEPDNGTQARIDERGNTVLASAINSYNTLGRFLSGSFLGRLNEGRVPSNVNQLPHLFFLNWNTNTARRVNGVGHYLVMDDALGWCLGTKTVDETVRFDNLPGYFSNGYETGHHKYIYLGSAVPVTVDGKCICIPGCRLLTNYGNPISYNDFSYEDVGSWSLSKVTPDNTYVPLWREDVRNIWKHYYLNPGTSRDIATSTGVMPGFAHPYGGVLRLGTAGGYQLRVVHDSGSTLLTYGGSPAEFTGNANCSYARAVMNNLVLGAGTPNLGGVNKIHVLAAPPVAGMSRTRNDRFIAGPGQFAYTPTQGFIADASNPLAVLQHNAQFPNDPAILTTPPAVVGVPGTNGFGMIGSC